MCAKYTGLLGLVKSKETMTEHSRFQLRSLPVEVLENSILRSMAISLHMEALGSAMTRNLSSHCGYVCVGTDGRGGE